MYLTLRVENGKVNKDVYLSGRVNLEYFNKWIYGVRAEDGVYGVKLIINGGGEIIEEKWEHSLDHWQLEDLVAIAESYYDLDCSVRTRKKEVVWTRQWYYAMALQLTKCSLASVGAHLGYDHATVLCGVKSLRNLIYTGDPIAIKMKEYYEVKINQKIDLYARQIHS